MNTIIFSMLTKVMNGSNPYNTTIPTNPAYFPVIITQNMSWFFPLILLFAFVWIDYVFSSKLSESGTQAGIKSLVLTSIAYTFMLYLVVLGGLTSSGMFFLFATIGFGALFFDTLLGSGYP